MAERPLRLPPSSSENSSSSTKRTLKERVRNALITGTAGGYLGGILVPEGKVRVKVPALLRKALKMKRRKTVGIHGARAGVAAGALIGGRNKGERSETVDAVATGGDWKFEERKPLTPGQKAALAGGGVLTAGGLVLGTARGRNALRSAMAGGSALGGLLSKVPGGQPRRVRLMKAQQKRKDLSNQRAANKAVEGARAKFRAEALPKAPAEPTLGDAVKTVRKRVKRKVVKAVSNIGANPGEVQLAVATGGNWKFGTGRKMDDAHKKWNATRTVSDPWGEPSVKSDFEGLREQMKRGKTREQWQRILKKMPRPSPAILTASLLKKPRPAGTNPWHFSAYVEDMTFSGLPKEVQKDVLRFVDAEKGTPVVHYGMTVKELIGKADPENLKAARKALGTLRASRAAAEVMGKIKDGSKYVLLMNDRIVDGHHHLAKAERAGVTSSLNVLDLTPARLSTGKVMEFSASKDRWKDEKTGAKIAGAALGSSMLGGALAGSAVSMPEGDLRKTGKLINTARGKGATPNERRVAAVKVARLIGRNWRKDAGKLAVIGAGGAAVGAGIGAGAVRVVKQRREKQMSANAMLREFGSRREFFKKLVGGVVAAKAAPAAGKRVAQARGVGGGFIDPRSVYLPRYTARDQIKDTFRNVRIGFLEDGALIQQAGQRPHRDKVLRRVMSYAPKKGWSKEQLKQKMGNVSRMVEGLQKGENKRLARASREVVQNPRELLRAVKGSMLDTVKERVLRGDKKPSLADQWDMQSRVTKKLWKKAEGKAFTRARHKKELIPDRVREDALFKAERLLWQFAEEQKKSGLRKAAIAGGLGVAAAGASLLPGAVPMLRLQGRRLLAQKTGKKSATYHGENVADYLDASQGALNRGVHGKIAGKVLQRAQKDPNSRLHKKLGRYRVDHFARFRAGTKEALGHWDYEVDANLKNKGLKRMSESLAKGRKRTQDAVNEQLWKHGKNESEALRAVAKNPDKDVQDYFRHLSRSKDKVYGGYAKKAALAPALVVAGGATAAAASRKKPQEKQMSANAMLWEFAPGDRAMHALRGLRLVSQEQRAAIRKKPLTQLKPFTPREELPQIQKNLRDNAAAKLKWLRAGKPADQLRWFEFEEPPPRERRNRLRDLRDRIGLTKDVAGLAGVTAAGVGGVKLYRAGQKAIKQTAPQVKAAARAWHRAGVKTGKTLDTVKDAVAPAAATNRGIKAVGSKIGAIARKATMWMHDDPRPVRAFARRREPVVVQPQRDGWQKARDASLIAGSAATVGGAGYLAHKGGKAISGLAKRGRAAMRQVPQVTDNIQNATSISADMGRVYRKARKVVTDSADAFKGGVREAAGKPAPSWAKRAVRVGKKLRLLESRGPSFKFQVSSSKFQVPSSKARMNEFIIGALGTIAGTLAGSAAGNKFRYPVQNALKKKLVPKLGVKWGRRVARAGGYFPENAGALAGGAAGSLLTGGMRKRKAEEEFSERSTLNAQHRTLNALAWRAFVHQFGGNEQLADLDNSRFVDPFAKWIKGEKGYRRADVGDYHKLRRRLLGRDLKPEQIAKIQGAMADIKKNKAVDVAGGQVLHSALRKADTVRKVSERGGGLVRDAVKAAKGEAREKDRWGREKKREWEKPWFQRRRNQLIAGAGLLAAGYVGRHTKVGARAVRKGEETIGKARNWANKKLANVFPDEGTEAARAAQNAKATGKPQSTPADILKQMDEQAKTTRKAAAKLDKANKKAAAKGPELKLVEEPESPAPAKPAAPVAPKPVTTAPAPKRALVRRTAAAVPQKKAASKPAVVKKAPAAPQVKAAPKPQAPPANTQELPVADQLPGAAWNKKMANKPKPKGRGKNQFEAAVRELLTQFAEKPFDGYNSKRHARTGGLNDSFRKSYNRENGANLKRPVTTKPSKLKAGSEAAGRRKSFCARMGGMPGATSKGGKLTPKGAALRRWNCMAIQALTQFADPLDVGWDIRDARGNSARVFAPQAGQRDRRPKRWHERVENERKLWAGAALTSTLAGGAAMRKLLGRQSDKAVKEALKRQAQQIGTAVKKRYVKKAAGGGGGKTPNVVRFDPAA
jgi:hypothetical protein